MMITSSEKYSTGAYQHLYILASVMVTVASESVGATVALVGFSSDTLNISSPSTNISENAP